MLQTPEARWYRAFRAYMTAQNPAFKAYWYGVMNHLRKDFTNAR